MKEMLSLTAKRKEALDAISQSTLPKILCISHGLGGGIDRHINELSVLLNERAILFVLEPKLNGKRLLLKCLSVEGLTFGFDWPEQAEALNHWLVYLGIERIHVHHVMGYATDFWLWINSRSLPLDLTLHDHSVLSGNPSLYSLKTGLNLDWMKGQIKALPEGEDYIALSLQQLMHAAERVWVPSAIMQYYLQPFFPNLLIHFIPHPESELNSGYPIPCFNSSTEQPFKVLCLGMLGIEKGAQVLDGVSRLAEKTSNDSTQLEFILLGDCHIPLCAQVRRLGVYNDADLDRLISQIKPDLLWLPAQCPETWSYTLSAGLRAGLPVLASALGVFVERLNRRPLSWMLPFNSDHDTWFQQILAIKALKDKRETVSARVIDSWEMVQKHHQAPFYTAIGKHSYVLGERSIAAKNQALLKLTTSAIERQAQLAMIPEQRSRQLLIQGLLWLKGNRYLQPILKYIPYAWLRGIKRKISKDALQK